MVKAIEAGIPKMRIEEAATRKQAKIDGGVDKIIGVNHFSDVEEIDLDILEVDNTQVRLKQLENLSKLKSERNSEAVKKALSVLQDAAESGRGNLLELAVEAARVRATLGEISSALEKHYGRYTAHIKSISGIYSSQLNMDENFKNARNLSDQFAKIAGRRPRILVAKLGQDGHDRGAKVISTGFVDVGFDVDIGPLFQTPAEAALMAAENDVHVLGVSSLAAGHKTLIPQVMHELEKIGRSDILVVCGGVIPKQDYDFLYSAGVVGVYGPGTNISKSAIDILELLIEGYSQL